MGVSSWPSLILLLALCDLLITNLTLAKLSLILIYYSISHWLASPAKLRKGEGLVRMYTLTPNPTSRQVLNTGSSLYNSSDKSTAAAYLSREDEQLDKREDLEVALHTETRREKGLK